MNDHLLLFLDLPVGSTLCLDGQSIVLQRDDFVGFCKVPTTTTTNVTGNHPSFHLVTIRAMLSSHPKRTREGTMVTSTQSSAAVTVGFMMYDDNDANESSNLSEHSSSPKSLLIRRYDSHTEEVSSLPVDDTTCNNLLAQIHANRMDPRRLLEYRHVLAKEEQIAHWHALSGFVSAYLLQKRGLQSNDKIVPGSYEENGDEDDPDHVGSSNVVSRQPTLTETNQTDGKSVNYPSIPVWMSSKADRSARHTKHLGTKRFMAKLSPSERTNICTSDQPSDRLLDMVLKRYYDNLWRNVLGDLQLSFLLFLQMHCYASLCHWRDLIAMLSTVSSTAMRKHAELYRNLLPLLAIQMTFMDPDFLDDTDLSENNVLVPSIKRLLSMLSKTFCLDSEILSSVQQFENVLTNRFPGHFLTETEENAEYFDNMPQSMIQSDSEDDDDELEDENDDGPVIVSSEDVEASLKRLSTSTQGAPRGVPAPVYPQSLRQEYPFLFAAMMPNEDILMTCARALDDACDVSVVREAAAYLETVEAAKAEHSKF